MKDGTDGGAIENSHFQAHNSSINNCAKEHPSVPSISQPFLWDRNTSMMASEVLQYLHNISWSRVGSTVHVWPVLISYQRDEIGCSKEIRKKTHVAAILQSISFKWMHSKSQVLSKVSVLFSIVLNSIIRRHAANPDSTLCESNFRASWCSLCTLNVYR